MSNSTKTIIIFTCCLLTAATGIAFGIRHYEQTVIKRNKSKQQLTKSSDPVYDLALLRKFQKMCGKYDTLTRSFTVRGAVYLWDKSDSLHKPTNTAFVFCKSGNDFYYRYGETVTINRSGLYIYIDNLSKRILVGAQKSVKQDLPVTSMSGMVRALQSEHYRMTGAITGDQQTISLTNELHITCKEYTVTFDTCHYQVNRIYSRLTNFQFPMDKRKEKIMEMQLSEWDSKVDIDHYPGIATVVLKTSKGWIKTKAYDNYQLINM